MVRRGLVIDDHTFLQKNTAFCSCTIFFDRNLSFVLNISNICIVLHKKCIKITNLRDILKKIFLFKEMLKCFSITF